MVSHPFQVASQALHNAARNKLEEAEVPFSKPTVAERRSAAPTRTTQTVTPTQTRSQTIGSSVAVKDSTLIGQTLTGRRSKYQVEASISESDPARSLLPGSNNAQLYRGSRSPNHLPVLIKEYDLTEFNSREMRQAKEKLERLDSLNFRSGGVQDFRLVVPSDTFLDQTAKRGYVITAYISEDRLSLRDYLIQEKRKGKMGIPPSEVRQILTQVLQTLWFMHNHPVRFADGAVQRGIAHGNLNLDSLLRIPDRLSNGSNQPQFYIYVNDLGIWKEPFQMPTQDSPVSVTPNQPVKRDLIHVGIIGFYLLVGETEGYPDRFADPKAHPHWEKVNDEPLKAIIRQLLGLDRTVSFNNADEVRQALERAIPIPDTPAADQPNQTLSPSSDHRWWFFLASLLMLLGAIGMGLLAWQWLSKIPKVEQILSGEPLSQLTAIDVPNQTFQYSISDTWRDVLGRGRVAADSTFAEVLTQRDIRFSRYQEDNRLPHDDPTLLAKLRTGEISFVLGTWDEATQQDLQHQVVAYDGVVVFVAFSDPERSRNVAKALDGKLSFQQLRKLYASGSDWIFPGALREMNVERYAPEGENQGNDQEQVIIQLFEQEVLQKPDLIENFENALGKQIQQQDFNTMVASILKNFEDDNEVGIGFSRLSKVLGQCSVYPLAIGPIGQEVQPIIADGKAITPAFDLCDRKGSYAPDAKLFLQGRYPLIYPLSVIYTAQGEQAAQAFIAALKTDEGQCLLAEAGLVPIEPVRQTGRCSDVQ